MTDPSDDALDPDPPSSANTTSASSTPLPAAASPALQRASSATNMAQTAAAASSRPNHHHHHHHSLSGPRSLKTASASPSAANSPQSSRDASPSRPPPRAAAAAAPAGPAHSKSGLRSRKSSADVSPSRGNSLGGPGTTFPSAASIQRALSSANIPQLSPAPQQDASTAPRPPKPTHCASPGDNTPRWPVSPRIKSPPPSSEHRSRSRRNSLRAQATKPEPSSTPAIVVQSSSPASASRVPVRDDVGTSEQQEEPAQSMKAQARGATGVAPKLETVQESSLPTSPPKFDTQSLSSDATTPKPSDHERNDNTSSKVTEHLGTKAAKQSESGSDSGTKNEKAKMQTPRSASSQRSQALSAKPSLSALSTIKPRAEQPSRNMTVETETVPSIAQATISNQERSASGRGDGSLRLKPSNETIRPKKERKAPKRKAPSMNSGTASSKADVFEQKVASAVDEADSSDSDATFIYESNPPEQQPHRSRHHSRTPSMTSITSLADPRLAIRDTHKNPNKKSSMKFANPYNNPPADADALDRGEGTVRSGSGRINHHHIGRHGGHGRGGLGHLVMDSDSSLAQSSRARGPSSRHPSQPNSPRFHTFNVSNANGAANGNSNGNGNGNGNGNKKQSEYSSYDIDTENAADDERTPLMSSARSPRVRTPRHRNSTNLLQAERRHRRNGGWCRRFAGCLVLSILLLVVVFCAVGLVFATTKPLEDVKVRDIQNVVASQDEIILDMIVDAFNPNIIGVTVADMDVVVFAKSKHVGSDRWWREHGNNGKDNQEDLPPIKTLHDEDENGTIVVQGGVDEGTDPEDPDIGEPRTMSLGHLFHFESPLNFDGSFFKHRRAESIGEIRLVHPGNKTEAGGTERWEEVLQYPFELIVRGNFKYQLPLSTRERKVSIIASYYYDPDIEKKKLESLESEHGYEKRRDPALSPLPVTLQPLGRFDRRASPLLRLDYQ